jgi:hypothetical protein
MLRNNNSNKSYTNRKILTIVFCVRTVVSFEQREITIIGTGHSWKRDFVELAVF